MTATRAEKTPPHYWRCANCRRSIGEVIGTQLVIVIRGERVYLSAVQWAARTCPNCGVLNERDGRITDERRVTA